jgi:2-C-methyl-D-erythritol 4-phosphate cytidylyltransferase
MGDDMATFSVLVLTAAPPGQASEGGGAFVKIDGREALLRSVELFLNRDNVKQIQLALLPDSFEESKRKFGPHLGFSGVKLISAGPRWMDQIAAAGSTISPEATHVIVHDAARPAVPYSDIDALMAAAEKNAAVALATPLRSTLVEVDEGGNPLAFHLPTSYMQLQTPQAYAKDKFQEMARSKTEVHPLQMTLLKGSPLNLRAGGPGEAGLLKTMIGMMPKAKSKTPFSPFEEAQW